MKKIFTLAAAIIMVASVSAQHNIGNQKGYGEKDNNYAFNDRGNDRHDDRRDGRYAFALRERDMKITQINREYDRKVEAVRHKWFMNRSKKEAWIYALEDQRRDEIKMMWVKFNNSNRRFGDGDFNRHW